MQLRRVVLIAVVAAGILAGCAKPDTQTPPTPQEAVAAASARTTAVGSARISRSIAWFDAAGNQVGPPMRIEGVIDFTHHLARLDTTTAKPPAGTSSTPVLTQVYTNNAIYWRLPPDLEKLANKHWVKLDLTTLPENKRPSVEAMVGLGQAGVNPERSLHQLDTLVNVTEVGREQLRGVDTRHLKGSVKDGFGIQVEVWLDDQDRTRRTRDTTPVPVPASTQAGLPPAPVSFVTTTDYYDFGTKVDVQVPPDSDTTDFEDFGSKSP